MGADDSKLVTALYRWAGKAEHGAAWSVPLPQAASQLRRMARSLARQQQLQPAPSGGVRFTARRLPPETPE